jgi:TRAP-type C4-dicarboxylate transport system permease small subunit
MGDGTAALSAAHRYWARLEDGMNLVAAAAIFFLMFVGVFQVVGRTVFDTAIHGYIDYMEQASALFAFLGVSYAQRVGAHIRMDLLLRGFSMRFLWSMELFCVLVALVVITVLIDSTFLNFLRAWQLGDSTIDIKLPVWPTKLIVPFVLVVLWVRLALQSFDYIRLVRYPDAAPIAVPVIETIEVLAKHEIEEALGREEKRP